jgi:hypothetical protein
MARKILKENLIDSLLFDASSRVRTIRWNERHSMLRYMKA